MSNVINFNSSKIIPARIKMARISRGYSLSDLADRLGVSKQAISQYEVGTSNPINIMNKIIEVLDYPYNFFVKPIKNIEASSATYFRSRKTTTQKVRNAANEMVNIFSDIHDYFEEYVEYPKLNLPNIEMKDEYSEKEIEKIANELRTFWGLGFGPINNIISVLQENGIIISKVEIGEKKIDAFSKWINCVPYIILSIDKNCAVRSRFDVAHELCHLLLHQYVSSEDLENKEKFEQIEKEANLFAASFLLPSKTFGKEIFSSSLENFVMLKEKWKVSISCMIKRCESLNILTESQVAYLKRQMTYKGYWQEEPLDDKIQCENPYLYNQIIDLLLDNNIVSINEIVNDIALESSEIEKYCYLEKNKLLEKNNKIVSIKNRLKN